MDGKLDRLNNDFKNEVNPVFLGVDVIRATIGNAESGLRDRFDDVDNRFNELDDKIDAIDLEVDFDDVDKRFNELDDKVDGIDNVVETRLDSTEDRLGQRLDRLYEHSAKHFRTLETRMQRQLDDTRALSRNRLCTQGWQRIEPVSYFSNGRGPNTLPGTFPVTVQRFWSLKNTWNRE
ncbi:MAG: hypothetical protein Q9169_007848 [Polycauliona sp. 2 TL-2023]